MAGDNMLRMLVLLASIANQLPLPLPLLLSLEGAWPLELRLCFLSCAAAGPSSWPLTLRCCARLCLWCDLWAACQKAERGDMPSCCALGDPASWCPLGEDGAASAAGLKLRSAAATAAMGPLVDRLPWVRGDWGVERGLCLALAAELLPRELRRLPKPSLMTSIAPASTWAGCLCPASGWCGSALLGNLPSLCGMAGRPYGVDGYLS